MAGSDSTGLADGGNNSSRHNMSARTAERFTAVSSSEISEEGQSVRNLIKRVMTSMRTGKLSNMGSTRSSTTISSTLSAVGRSQVAKASVSGATDSDI